MQHSEARDSGASGAGKPASPSMPVSTVSLPETPEIPQKVKFFTARTTFIAESSLEDISAINFDAWIIQLFGDIEVIDREKWDMADRLYALNTALDQQAERRADEHPYARLDALPDGRHLLTIVEPVEATDTDESAIKTEAAQEEGA